jgi:tetratricopeptide (TPR) repeat protein
MQSADESIIEAYEQWRRGSRADAKAICERVLNESQNHPGARHLLGLMAHAEGDSEQALEHLRRGSKASGAPFFVHDALAQLCLERGLSDEAAEAGRCAVAADATQAGAWHRLAIALIQLHRFAEARAALERAVSLEPRSIAALNNLGTVFQQLGRADLAAESYRNALAIDPANAEAHSNLTAALGALGKHDEALAHARRAIELRPDFVNPYVHAALVEASRDAFDAALQWIDTASLRGRENAAMMIARADILRRLHRYDEGTAACRRVLELAPLSSDAYNSLAMLLQAQARDEEAIAAFDRAISLAPILALPLANKAALLMECGRQDEALAAIERAHELDPTSASIEYTRAMMRQFALDEAEIAVMEELAVPDRTTCYSDRMYRHFALGGAYLERDNADRAFHHLEAGNQMKRALVRYDADAEERRMTAIATTFSPSLMSAAQAFGSSSELPIFVVGMPRSGTTLIEQILASHPEVHGAGELRFVEAEVRRLEREHGQNYPDFVPHLAPAAYREIAGAYIAQLGKPTTATRVVDKMIINSLYVGLIHLAFPRARIILCRRDPLDTCLSCYSKLFTSGLEFSYDLGELGRYYRAHDRLMEHWRSVLPAESFLEIEYERVVADLESSARRLVEFCGLTWSPACLQFHKTERPVRTASMVQVRKPLYRSSIGRWREFRAHLGPLIEALGLSSAPE